jgi:hypothetical protein
MRTCRGERPPAVLVGSPGITGQVCHTGERHSAELLSAGIQLRFQQIRDHLCEVEQDEAGVPLPGQLRRRIVVSHCLAACRSRWLSHKSITTTVDLCGYLVPEGSGRARDALDGAFAEVQATAQKKAAPRGHVPRKCPEAV